MSLQYPIGRYTPPALIDAKQISEWLDDSAQLPAEFRVAAAAVVTAGKLDSPYRPGGWTARQVIHHVPDSHLNAYARIKLTLTEDHPTVRPYDEVGWAQLVDYHGEIEASLELLNLLHARLVGLLRAVPAADWERTYYHPANDETNNLASLLGHYVWHGRHHLGHLKLLL